MENVLASFLVPPLQVSLLVWLNGRRILNSDGATSARWLGLCLAVLLAVSASVIAVRNDDGAPSVGASSLVGRTDSGMLVTIRVSGASSSGLSVLRRLPDSPCGGTYLVVDALASRVLLTRDCTSTADAPAVSELVIADTQGGELLPVPGSRLTGNALGDATAVLVPGGYVPCVANSCAVTAGVSASARTVYSGTADVRALSAAGQTVLLGERLDRPPYTRLLLLDSVTGQTRRVLPSASGGRLRAAISPDGRTVALVGSGTDTSATTLWDLASGGRLVTVHGDGHANVDQPAWTTAGQLYVEARSLTGNLGHLYLVDPKSGDVTRTNAPEIPFGYLAVRAA